MSYNTINNCIDDNTNDLCSQSIRELEEEAHSTMERLSRARNDRAREMSCKMISHHMVDSDVDRCGHVTDKNINQAMQQLHTPKQFPKETPGEFESRMAASARMHAKHRDEERAEWRRLHRIRELDKESNQLACEQSIYESTRSKCNIDSEQVRENPRNDSKDSLWRDRAMRRREHYREWLGSQNIIDSI